MDHFIRIIQDGLLRAFKFPELVTMLISTLPIVEARGAIPIGFGYGLHPFFAFLFAFLGSSLMAPILIAALLPFVKWLAKTRAFKKVGQTLYEKFEQKSRSITGSDPAADENAPPQDATQKNGFDKKKFWGIFAFVAIPLPLTGVWTGSAVAAVTQLKYRYALPAVIAGNLVASGILTLLCFFFSEWINYIILVIGIIAILVVIALIVKIILHKSPQSEQEKIADNKENE